MRAFRRAGRRINKSTPLEGIERDFNRSQRRWMRLAAEMSPSIVIASSLKPSMARADVFRVVSERNSNPPAARRKRSIRDDQKQIALIAVRSFESHFPYCEISTTGNRTSRHTGIHEPVCSGCRACP